jgi:hypothetical protein
MKKTIKNSVFVRLQNLEYSGSSKKMGGKFPGSDSLLILFNMDPD